MSLGVDGLWTNMNPIDGRVPAGGLRRADNIVIDQPGKASPRRNTDLVQATTALFGPVRAAFEYEGAMFAWDGTQLNIGSVIDNDVDYEDRGDAAPVDGLTIRHATGGGDLYVTSPFGPLMLDGTGGTLKRPGVARPPDIATTTVSSIADPAGPIPANSAAAFKIVFGYLDTEGRPVLSEPSGRYVMRTGAGGPYVAFFNYIAPPLGVTNTSGHFVQVYRTRPVALPADPGDTYFLVYETPWTDAVQVYDLDPLGDTPLYTNPDRGGVASANVRPPIARDLVPFRNRMWLANTTTQQRLRLRLLGDPGLGKSITIGGVTYPILTGGGTPSQNIEVSARSIVDAVNLTGGGIRAAYVSGIYDAPGIFEVFQDDPSAPAFTAESASAGGFFEPTLLDPRISRSDIYRNRLHFSREGLHYAFPLSSTLQVGAEESAIVRIAALRDALFVFKETDGLWKVTGNGPFYVEQVNASVRLVSPDALAVVDNSIIAASSDGILQVSEAGVDTIDIPVGDRMLAAIRDGRMAKAKFIARESHTEKKVYVGLPSLDSAYPVESYVYNVNTETWVRDSRAWSAGFVRSDGRLALFPPEEVGDFQLERNTGNPALDSAGVECAIGWNTETAGAAGDTKQFVMANILFEEPQPYAVDAEAWFTADDGTQGPAVLTGGEGLPYIRAEVPPDQQRTSRLGVELRWTASQAHTLLGVDVRYKLASGLVGVKGR